MTETITPPDQVFRDFRIASMDQQHPRPYGEIPASAVGVKDGKISWIRPQASVPEYDHRVEIISGKGRWLTPGLIDCHTHLVYGGNRANEWEMRLNGKSYEEIAHQGGGILSTVKATRAASEQDLLNAASARLRRLMEEGVTTIEIKSGYGLDVENELKMLRVANALASDFPVSVVSTLLGAHAVPPEFKGKSDDYVDLVCGEMIPAAKDTCSSVDVFCESIAFDLDQTRRVFEAALDAGLQIKVHAEQLSRTGAAAMAADMGAISADHLEYLSAADCQVLSRNRTVATLLPGAFYCLKETRKPPVQALREHDVPIAIATDCNPGSSPVVSILLIANFACTLFGLTPEEALAGITRNAALALKLDQQVGTIAVGKRADLVAWDVGQPAEIVHGLGHNPVSTVYKNGILVDENGKCG